MNARAGLRLVLALGVTLLSACSSFNAQWKAAANSPTASRWDGRWTSDSHKAPGGGRMGGRLRAVIEPAPDGRWAAHFRANWLAFSGDYKMTLEPKTAARPRRGVSEFRGTHELPKIFGGTYRYEGQIAGDQFRARYESAYDNGIFALQRLPAVKDSPAAHARD